MICSRLLVLHWICSSTLIAFLFINNFQRPLPSTGNIYPVPSAGKLVISAKHGKTVVALTLLWLTTDCYEEGKTFAVLTQCKQTFAITSWYKGRHTVGVTKRGHIIQRQISSYDINYSMQFLSERHVAWNLVGLISCVMNQLGTKGTQFPMSHDVHCFCNLSLLKRFVCISLFTVTALHVLCVHTKSLSTVHVQSHVPATCHLVCTGLNCTHKTLLVFSN